MEVISKGSINATKQYEESTTLGQILDDFHIKENRLCVIINGKYHETLDETFLVSANDVVFVMPEFSGGQRGVKIASSIILLAATVASAGAATAPGAGLFTVGGGAFGLAAARVGILVGATLLVAGLQALAPQSLGDINGAERAESPTYSLTASGNSVRPYQPLPMVLGTHNIFPDFSSRPYNEFQTYQVITYQTNTWIGGGIFTEDAVNMTVPFLVLAPVTGEVFNFFSLTSFGGPVIGQDYWRRYGGTTAYADTQAQAETTPPPLINDAYRRTYVLVDTCPALPALNGTWVSWEDFNLNGSGATFIPGLTFTNLENYIYDTIGQGYPLKTEVVKQIMNYGFGDLSYVSNQIGTTSATDFRQYVEDDISQFANQTPFNWPLIQSEPDFTTTSIGLNVASFLHVNGNVDTVEGGRLDSITGFLYPNNWVIRQGPDNTFAIQLDIEGRQFALDKANGGTSLLLRTFNIEYRQISPAITPWVKFPDSMTNGNAYSEPYEILHGSSGILWRDTVFVDNLSAGQYEVQARRIEPNEESADIVSEIYFKRARFYQLDESQNYVAQNRKAIIVESDSQLSGTLNKLSSLVDSKCWVNDGSGVYTWTDLENDNPADWFLFIARGGFYNTSADGTLTYPYSPTKGWVNSADHPDNGERMFGAGISDSRIDFDALTNWRNFCDSRNLKFNAVLDDPQNVSEVLKKIASVGRASPTWAQGKLGVVFEDVNDVPVAMFGPDNMIRDSFEYSYLTEDLPDEIKVNFMNPDKNWSQDTVTALAPGVTNPTKSVTVDFWGITDEDQAQREANLLAARQVYQRRLISFSTDAEGIIVTRGDVVYISHDVTTWDYESRIISTLNDGVNIISFKLNIFIDDAIQFVTIRYPDNQINTFACTIVNGEVLLTDPWPLMNAPYILDDSNTINPLSLFSNSIPEDFMAFLGARATPGKKVRIVGVSPQNDNLYRIDCIDEEAGFYAQEFAITGVPPAEQYERIKAEVVSASFILKENGKAEIYWELNGAIAVTIQISINASPYVLLTQGNGATVYGESIEIQYGVGDQVDLIINPVYTDAPFIAISQPISLVLV